MKECDSSRGDRKAPSDDLREYDIALTNLLPVLLFSRDRDALVRWCKTRAWVDNALQEESSPDLLIIGIAVAYLLESADRAS